MAWEVQLVGDTTDLRMLADSFAGDDLAVEAREAEFVLIAAEFEGLSSAGEVRDRAAELARNFSGATRLLLGSHRAITVGGVYRIREDGGRDITVFPDAATVRVRALPATVKVTNADGSVEVNRPADPIVELVQTAVKDPAVRKALRLRDVANLDWPDLYRIFDVIEAHAGAVAKHGWASKADIKRFKHSANSVAVAGDSARHGHESTEPPAKPMSISDARRFVDGLLRQWLA